MLSIHLDSVHKRLIWLEFWLGTIQKEWFNSNKKGRFYRLLVSYLIRILISHWHWSEKLVPRRSDNSVIDNCMIAPNSSCQNSCHCIILFLSEHFEFYKISLKKINSIHYEKIKIKINIIREIIRFFESENQCLWFYSYEYRILLIRLLQCLCFWVRCIEFIIFILCNINEIFDISNRNPPYRLRKNFSILIHQDDGKW